MHIKRFNLNTLLLKKVAKKLLTVGNNSLRKTVPGIL